MEKKKKKQPTDKAMQNRHNSQLTNTKVPGADNYFETAEELAGRNEHGARKQAKNPEKGV